MNTSTEWKAIFHRTVDAIRRNKAKYNQRMWEIDDASVFAQIDAFVQRCRDLIEVCENQMQFVRKTAATKGLPGPLPQFGGTKASEIISSLHTIENSFQQQIDHLRGLDYDVLDVRVARWHDDYHDFKGNDTPYQFPLSTQPTQAQSIDTPLLSQSTTFQHNLAFHLITYSINTLNPSIYPSIHPSCRCCQGFGSHVYQRHQWCFRKYFHRGRRGHSHRNVLSFSQT